MQFSPPFTVFDNRRVALNQFFTYFQIALNRSLRNDNPPVLVQNCAIAKTAEPVDQLLQARQSGKVLIKPDIDPCIAVIDRRENCDDPNLFADDVLPEVRHLKLQLKKAFGMLDFISA